MAFDFNSTTNKNYLQTINPNTPDAGAALKVLSLNLPNFLGGNPIAPDGLLRPGLSTSAQVGGTAAPTPAPASGSAPSAQSPFPTSSSPLAGMASDLIGTNNFTPPTAPGAPNLIYTPPGAPRDAGADLGGSQPTPPPDSLADVLTALLKGVGSGGGAGEGRRQ